MIRILMMAESIYLIHQTVSLTSSGYFAYLLTSWRCAHLAVEKTKMKKMESYLVQPQIPL